MFYSKQDDPISSANQLGTAQGFLWVGGAKAELPTQDATLAVTCVSHGSKKKPG